MKILIVSLGSIGKRHFKNASQLIPNAEFAFLRHKKSIEDPLFSNCKFFYSLKEAVSFKPEIVIVSSPASLHKFHSLPFINKGINIFIEKPLEIIFNQTKTLVNAAKKSNSFSMVGYVLRFQPIFRKIKEIIDSEYLGKIYLATIHTGQYLPDWRPNDDYKKGVSANKKLGGGVLLELSHEIDYAQWLFGKPTSIYSSHNKFSNLDLDVEDNANIIFEYPNKRVNLQIDFLSRVPKMKLQIIGSEKILEADLIKEKIEIQSASKTEYIHDEIKMKNFNEIYLRQFDFFFSKSMPDYKPLFKETNNFSEFSSIDNAAYVIKLIDMANLSNLKGKKIFI